MGTEVTSWTLTHRGQYLAVGCWAGHLLWLGQAPLWSHTPWPYPTGDRDASSLGGVPTALLPLLGRQEGGEVEAGGCALVQQRLQ